MFESSEVIGALKTLASVDRPVGRTYCQALDVYAQQLGYESYHHLSKSLKALPSDRLGKVSLKLMRQICARRLPSSDGSYCSFTAFPDGSFGYYSHWIGWGPEGEEVRVPSPLNGRRTAENFRQFLDHPIYVVESEKELMAWQWRWLAGAVIPIALAKKFFPGFFNQKHLVAQNPPLEKVRRQAVLRQRRVAEALRT